MKIKPARSLKIVGVVFLIALIFGAFKVLDNRAERWAIKSYEESISEELSRIVKTSDISKFLDPSISSSWSQISKEQLESLLQLVDPKRIENSDLGLSPHNVTVYVRTNSANDYEFKVHKF